jgi:2-dehydropantoate 2-reductase
MTVRRARVAIVGGGAMGGLWAARLSAVGHDVAIVDVSRPLIEAVVSRGLTLHDAFGTIQAAVRATDDPEQVGRVDAVVVFVKGLQTPAAAARLGPLLGDDTTVTTLQNGWGNADALAEHVSTGRIVVGVTYEGATVEEPAVVRHGGSGPTYVGGYDEDGSLEAAERVAELFVSGGFDVTATRTARTEIWRKLIHNAACLAVSGLTGLRAAALVEPGPCSDLVDDLAREAVAVARAIGLDITAEERIEGIHAVLRNAGDGVPSMLADVMARRPTEVDLINGAIVRAGDGAGLDAPLHRAMVRLVHALESSWPS